MFIDGCLCDWLVLLEVVCLSLLVDFESGLLCLGKVECLVWELGVEYWYISELNEV